MRSWATSAALLVAIGWALPAAAQDRSAESRLDDFAIAPGDGSLRVEQVSPETLPVQSAPQPRDRTITGAPPTDRPSLRPDQLSGAGGESNQAQLNDGADPTRPIPTAGSTAADSRPEGVTRLAGTDRCDPQLPESELEQCLRILELRAQEFNAPAPPRLSAEQTLLAAQQTDEERSMSRSSDVRLRLATVQAPDAGLGSNQELASIYLDRSAPTGALPREEEAPLDVPSSITEILVALTQGGQLPPEQ